MGCLVLYDITDRSTYEAAKELVTFAKSNLHEKVFIGLAGTKLDLVEADPTKRAVTEKEA